MALQVIRRDDPPFSFSPQLQINPFLDCSKVKLRDIRKNLSFGEALESRIDHTNPVMESFSPAPFSPFPPSHMPGGSLPSLTGDSTLESDNLISQLGPYYPGEPGIFYLELGDIQSLDGDEDLITSQKNAPEENIFTLDNYNYLQYENNPMNTYEELTPWKPILHQYSSSVPPKAHYPHSYPDGNPDDEIICDPSRAEPLDTANALIFSML